MITPFPQPSKIIGMSKYFEMVLLEGLKSKCHGAKVFANGCYRPNSDYSMVVGICDKCKLACSW